MLAISKEGRGGAVAGSDKGDCTMCLRRIYQDQVPVFSMGPAGPIGPAPLGFEVAQAGPAVPCIGLGSLGGPPAARHLGARCSKTYSTSYPCPIRQSVDLYMYLSYISVLTLRFLMKHGPTAAGGQPHSSPGWPIKSGGRRLRYSWPGPAPAIPYRARWGHWPINC